MSLYEVAFAAIPGLWVVNGLSQPIADVGRWTTLNRLGMRLLLILGAVASFACVAAGRDGYPAAIIVLAALAIGGGAYVVRTARQDLARLHIGVLAAIVWLLVLCWLVFATATVR